ncbi:amidase [Candidimonas sp. SYP-B2681]|uniref:amidase n=1 Tax=Candidimonas sp. SYP-B2681 TaxID=2497686 RepID=UPI000F86AC3B|nr:amidase [Candidimonas sp. SYP-B2681]RTZ41734.1 amidase [Candidimonas sp. SYP-B2681]
MKRPDLMQPGLQGAFVKDGFARGPSVPRTSTQLEGMRLAVKDVFDVEGLRTGAGNPVWWQAQHEAGTSAFAVSALLAAGAEWLGKTVTDELAFSLTGANVHYGTPVNPADACRIPGGSSSGSAVAIAAGHADIGLATDCGGSARLPASYCGVWGIRPTHGYAGKSGFPLAPSFDTVGWFTRSGEALMDVLRVLIPDSAVCEPRAWLVPDDALAICDPAVKAAMANLLESLKLSLKPVPSGSLPLGEWADAYRVLAGAEIWGEHGSWVTESGDHLAADVRARFIAASELSVAEVDRGQIIRRAATQTLDTLLSDNAVILMPTAPGPAPLCTAAPETLLAERQRVQKLLSGAGLAGLPQVSFPWITVNGAPVGLSVIGARGSDAAVVHAAMLLDQALSRQ